MKAFEFIACSMLVSFMLGGCDAQQTSSSEPVAATEQMETRPDVPDNAGKPGVVQARKKPGPDEVKATMLAFEEIEPGTDPYTVQMVITDGHIRIDTPGGGDGFVLFDRKKKRIYSILHLSRRILVVDPPGELSATPDDLVIREESEVYQDAPPVAGVKPVHFRFFANGTLCYNVVAIKDFLPDVSQALQEYQMVLAIQQQSSLDIMPPELQTSCFRANYVYAAPEYVSRGFPFEQWDVEGYHRTLVSFRTDQPVSKDLFAVPEGYRLMGVGEGPRMGM